MLKEAIQKHYDRLSIKREKFPNGNYKYVESDEEFFSRLNGELQELKRNEGRDSVVFIFNTYFDKAKRQLPNSNEIELIKYALENFKIDRTSRTPYGDEALEWYNLPIEKIVDKYGEFLAYQKLLVAPSPNIKDSCLKKGFGRPKTDSYIFKWKDEYFDELKELHRFLINEEDPFVEIIGLKEFEENFLGKKIQKIVWIKQVGLLIYLLDNLYGLIDEGLYSKKGDNHIISSAFIKNFSCKKDGKIFDLTINTIYTARSRFNKGLDKEKKSDKNFKKIQVLIQQLTDNFQIQV